MNRRGQDRVGPLGGSGMVGQWGASSLIKSIQYLSITIPSTGNTQTGTITSVDTAHSFIIFGGGFVSGSSDANQSKGRGRVALTNATTVTATLNTAPNANYIAKAVVVEMLPGVIKSIQAGTILGAATATVTEVNVAKAWLLFLGFTTALTTGETAYAVGQTLTNGTTITQTEGISQTQVGGYMLVETF